MKSLLLSLALLISFNTFSEEGYPPYKLLKETKNYVTYVDKYDVKYAFIKGLENDLFGFHEIKKSRGPKWKGLAEEYLEGEHDFYEWASYWGERIDSDCLEELGGYDADIYEEWELRWNAVKKTTGSKKSVMYVVDFVTVLSSTEGSCELHDAQYVFNNKKIESLKDAEKVYLGHYTSRLPRTVRK